MREIKFKYIFKHRKDEDYQSEVYTLDRIQKNDFNFILNAWSIDGYELVDRLGFCGLIDKDKNDICEGDILETEQISYNIHGTYEGMKKKIGVVEFNHGKYGLRMLNGGFPDLLFSAKYHKKIGNIYMNSELLTKE